MPNSTILRKMHAPAYHAGVKRIHRNLARKFRLSISTSDISTMYFQLSQVKIVKGFIANAYRVFRWAFSAYLNTYARFSYLRSLGTYFFFSVLARISQRVELPGAATTWKRIDKGSFVAFLPPSREFFPIAISIGRRLRRERSGCISAARRPRQVG